MNLGILSFNSSSDTYWLAVHSWWQAEKGQRVCRLHKVSTHQASCYRMARKWLLRLSALQFGVHQITDLKIPSRASGSQPRRRLSLNNHGITILTRINACQCRLVWLFSTTLEFSLHWSSMCVYVHGSLLLEKNSSRDGSEGRIAVSIWSKGSVLTGTEDGFVPNNIKWGSCSSSIIKYHHFRLSAECIWGAWSIW